MPDPLAPFWIHTTQVERKTGQGPTGPTYAPKTATVGFAEDVTRLVRSATGTEVVSSTTVYYPSDTPPIPAGSYVTTPAGRRAKVITCAVHDGGDLGLPDHVEVTLE